MKPFSCWALTIVGLLIISQTHAEFVQVGLKTYYVERDLMLSWHDAWNYCAANNMALASMETDLERRLLEPILKNNYFWLSGNELAAPSPNTSNRKFVWGNLGRPITYTYWRSDEPNNITGKEHCIHTYNDLRWNDRDCTVKLNFLCQA